MYLMLTYVPQRRPGRPGCGTSRQASRRKHARTPDGRDDRTPQGRQPAVPLFCFSQLAEDLLERLDDFVAGDATARTTNFSLNCLAGGRLERETRSASGG